MSESALDRLARRCGILPEYWQVDGAHRPCEPDTQRALLSAMGVPAATDSEAADTLAMLESDDAARPFPGTLLVTAGEPADVDLPEWIVETEDGAFIRSDAGSNGLPPLPAGVHTLSAQEHQAIIIASPPRAPSLSDIAGADKAWGVWTSLYGQRSDRNLGVGDYEDLAQLAEVLAAKGAAFVGINPIHARGVAGTDPSPYAPSSRTALDPSHIALDRVPELAASPAAQALMEGAEAALAEARRADLVDYASQRMLVHAVLRALFETFEEKASGVRRADFERWKTRFHPVARRQAIYEALSERHGSDWRDWPAALQDFDNETVSEFIGQNEPAIRFHEWCEWVAEDQLAEAQARGKRAGMALGLYLDIAVGVRPGGAETWAIPGAFASGVSLGAPPDQLNVQGQRWNLAGFSPMSLENTGYRPFRRMLRSTMAAAGIVRIDHVIGLARSFWVPDDGTPGGYVEFPTDVLLALIRIEAQRAGCLVVGEDLGTVPEGLREAMAESGLYGCSIMPFERAWEGLAAPSYYRPHSLASFGTHDLPTLAGWWSGAEIDLRRVLGHYDDDTAANEHTARSRDRISLCHLLADHVLLPDGLDPDDPPATLDDTLRDAVHALLAGGAPELVALGLDDIFGITDQQNVPGTTDEAPNWRRRAPVAIEDLTGAPDLTRTAEILNGVRPGSTIKEKRQA